ncbi:hypothetical protein AQUCO_00900907v1 [Aquilegia coerulea]|uniref:Transcription factor IIA alpha/beta subunit n=1 Tax=Aquilegia coerulea TaxID=218851 RepID=A0A2G5EFY9_AQUCA|nr:hypothetical protein AQUCO_00900907v1 [Aquilegia coerulea]
MATTTTSTVYINVIEDVVNKVREEFVQSGVDETVLNELQGLWELKMMQCGAVCGPIERPSMPKLPPAVPSAGGPTAAVHDLNVPYEPTEEYETPTAEMLFPPTPLQTPMQTPLPGTAQTPLPGTVQTPLPGNTEHYHLPTPSDYTSGQDTVVANEVKPGRPSPYMQAPSPWMNQRPLGVDVNVAYVEGRDDLDRGNPQQPTTQDFFTMSAGKRKREDLPPHFHGGGYIPQQDGAGDASFEGFQTELYPYQGVASEDYNTVNTPANHELHAGTPNAAAQNEAVDDDEEPPLNENDDDEFDDADEGEEPNTQHLVLAQFDKVTRTKSRWKCTLKDGIMHINNKDVLFTKATGEFEF